MYGHKNFPTQSTFSQPFDVQVRPHIADPIAMSGFHRFIIQIFSVMGKIDHSARFFSPCQDIPKPGIIVSQPVFGS
jgi:hypothetical protein